MKKILHLVALFLFISTSAFCQDILVLKGTVKCYIEQNELSTKGAQNVIVVPGPIPAKTGMTGPQGYYEINTAMPLQKLDGKYVVVYYLSSCKQCEKKKNIFISEDQVKPSGDKKLSYLTVQTMLMNAGCKNTELKPMQSDSIYNVFVKQPAEDLDKVSNLNVLTASPGLLNLLTNLVTVAAVSNAGAFLADTLGLGPGKIKYGNFLFASPMNLSGNTGFNFSPSRDYSEAVFWNPAALANTYQKGGLNLFTNLKNNVKLSGFVKVNDKFVIGAGGIYTYQDNFRKTRFKNAANPSNTISIDSHFQKLKEYAAFLAPAYKINNMISVGAAIKSIWQNFNVPDSLQINVNPNRNDFFDRTISKQHFDVDISANINATRSFRIGINAMNLAGTKLYADAFPARKKIVSMRNLRSVGLGLCYKYKQFNFGADALYAENDLYDVSVGVNYIPFNNAMLAGGFAFKQQSYSFSFKWKQFKLSYVNDNDLMINEKRKGKINLLQGRLYSGFAFAF